MSNGFRWDVFLSYSTKDEGGAERIYQRFRDAGLRVFKASHDLAPQMGKKRWEEKLLTELRASDHLAVYCTENSISSKWVDNEIYHFNTYIAERTVQLTEGAETSHKIIPIPDSSLGESERRQLVRKNQLLRDLLYPEDEVKALVLLTSDRIESLNTSLDRARDELVKSRELAQQSFQYYRHARFWKPFLEAPDRAIHIFTCGRNLDEDTDTRGEGGRTSIDKWDYQAAVDVTHYFARHHRDVGVVIERPVSKADIDANTRSYDVTPFTGELFNKNCVVIGSPDVNDFAELALSRIFGLKEYTPEAALPVAFRIRKAGSRFSTFYEAIGHGTPGGIALYPGDGSGEIFFAAAPDRDYGILVFADNPFSNAAPQNTNKILILAGHSGIATRAMSLLLTSEEQWCLDAFYDLDQKAVALEGSFAAVVEVQVHRNSRISSDTRGDNREILPRARAIRVRGVLPLDSGTGAFIDLDEAESGAGGVVDLASVERAAPDPRQPLGR